MLVEYGQWVGLALVVGGAIVTVLGFLTRREQGPSLMLTGASQATSAMPLYLKGDGFQLARVVCFIATFALLAVAVTVLVVRRRRARR